MNPNTYHLIRLVELTRDMNAKMITIDQARDGGNPGLAKAITIELTHLYATRAQVTLNAIQDGVPVEALIWVTQGANADHLTRLVADGPLAEDVAMLMAIQAQINHSRDNAMLDKVEAKHGLKPKARKASPVLTAEMASMVDTVVARLRKVTTEAEAQEILAGRHVPLLREISKVYGMGKQSKLTKTPLIASIVFHAIGHKLNMQAILNARPGY